MASSSDSTNAPSRRAFITHAVASGVAATQPPIFLAAGASSLALACDWAVDHMALINSPRALEESWSDARLNYEMARFDDVLIRATEEPSRSTADLVAKARLLLCEWRPAVEHDDASIGERALATLLREIIALAA